jgi:hypothetical protein
MYIRPMHFNCLYLYLKNHFWCKYTEYVFRAAYTYDNTFIFKLN